MKDRMVKLDWENRLHDGHKRRRLEQDNEMPFMFYRDILSNPTDMSAWNVFYVAHVTHPKEQNWSGNSRGRTTHYSESNKVGSKSLCNMIVTTIHRESIDVRTDSCFSGTNNKAGCLVCSDKAKKMIKEWRK